MQRLQYVTNRLTSHCFELGVLPVVLSRAEWDVATYEDPSNLHKPYGWVPPFEDREARHPEACGCYHCRQGHDPQTIYIPFCPDIITEQSLALDDELFENYVDVVEWSFSLQITHRDLPWQEREALIDKLLLDEGEGSMQLQNDVQMASLDRGHDGQPY